MFINVGAIFAPMVAIGVRNWWLSTKGFLYNPDLPDLCHGFLGGNLSPEASERFAALAAEVSSNGAPTDMAAFADSYLSAFATGFHYAFGVAIAAMPVIAGHFFWRIRKACPIPVRLRLRARALGSIRAKYAWRPRRSGSVSGL